jgi:hypothetical protein
MAQAPRRPLSRFLMLVLTSALLASASAQTPPDPAVEAAILGFRTAPAADSGAATRTAETL